MKKLILLAVCFCASTCIAQGVRYDSVALNPRGAPIPNATITLCTGTATGTPCSPAALGYTDITTSISCASGFPVVQQVGGGCTSTTDGNGNFGFWLVPGTYKYSISGPSVATAQTYTITLPVGATAGGSATITGALTAGSGNFVNAGVFTNTQMNNPVTSSVNSLSFGTEFHTINNNSTLNTVSGFSSGVSVPGGATVYQADGVEGYVACGTLAVNCVGGYFQARPLINGHQSVWGFNSVASDIGFTGTVIVGGEIDTNVTSATSTVQGIQLNGTFSAQPGSAIGVRATKMGGIGVWTAPFLTDSGASAVIGLALGAVGTGASSASQSVQFTSFDGGGIGRNASMLASLNGDILLEPSAGRAISNLSAPHAVVAEFGTDGSAQQALNVALTKGVNVSDSGGVTLNMGVDDGGPAAWIQARDFAGDSAQRAIRLNALGGDVLIGQTADNGAGNYLLQVNGGAQIVGTVRTGNTVRVTSDFTSANSAALQAITGLSIVLPAVAVNYSFHCALMYSQATPVAGDQFGIGVITNAPTSASAFSTVNTNATTLQYGVLTGLNSTTPTAVVTFTPAVTTVLGAVLDGTIEAVAAGSTFNVYVLNGTAADVIVVKKDSYCTLFPM